MPAPYRTAIQPFGDFNTQFERALQSKLALQGARAEDYSQAARQKRIGTNIDLNVHRTTYDPIGEYTRPNLEFGGTGSGQSAIDVFDPTDPQSHLRRPERSAVSAGDYGAPQPEDEYETYSFAEGGEVPGSPMMADYNLYQQAAKAAGIPALPMKQAIPMMAQARAAQRQKLLQAISGGATMPSYADGGEVDIGGAMVTGPGTGKSDSIPAMIDGHQPAAVSNGEIVIPKEVVDYYGTKMLDALVEKARLAGKAKNRKGAINA